MYFVKISCSPLVPPFHIRIVQYMYNSMSWINQSIDFCLWSGQITKHFISKHLLNPIESSVELAESPIKPSYLIILLLRATRECNQEKIFSTKCRQTNVIHWHSPFVLTMVCWISLHCEDRMLPLPEGYVLAWSECKDIGYRAVSQHAN